MNKLELYAIGYNSKCTGLALCCRYKKKRTFLLYTNFESGRVIGIENISHKDVFDIEMIPKLQLALLDYDFEISNKMLNKIKTICDKNEITNYKNYLKNILQMKTENQKRSYTRNSSIMQLTGTLTKLNKMKEKTTSTAVTVRIHSAVDSIYRLIDEIKDTTYESWKA